MIGKTVRIAVSATSFSNSISEGVFYIDGEALAALNAEPWEFNWKMDNVEIGMHSIKAIMTDHSGLSSDDEIAIEIMPDEIPVFVTDSRDGNVYKVAKIGEQVWMTENLRYKNEFAEFVNKDASLTGEYGYLYKTHIGTGEGVCPEDWHIPTRENWAELITCLGGDSVAGGKLKEAGIEHWKFPNTGATNWSGFSALPAGSLTREQLPEAYGSSARFFTAFYSNYIFLDFDSEAIEMVTYHPSNEFFSIRCMRDY